MLWDCRNCQIDLTMRLFQKLACCLIFRNLSDSHKMHNSQKPKLNLCFENWITKTRSSFYFLPINAQTNISFNLFFWEWTFLIHQSPFDRTFEAWKPIAINQNYNQKEFLNTHHNYILSPGRAVGTGGAGGQWLPNILSDHILNNISNGRGRLCTPKCYLP